MSYHRHYRLNADEVATILTLVDAELFDALGHNCPFGYINLACSDPDYDEDAVADSRYVARLALITMTLQSGEETYEELPSAWIQHTPETCPGRPCGDCCDHREWI